MNTICLPLLLMACSSSLGLSQPSANNFRPFIGVLAQESGSSDLPGDTYINANYFKFIQCAGARAVPIFVGKPESYYESLFSKINGVLFPGGRADPTTSLYAKAGRVLYKLAVQANDAGDYFPLWGTCLGSQFLACTTADSFVLNKTDSYNMTLPLSFTKASKSSRLFKDAPGDVVHYLQSEPVTENFHHYSVLVDEFTRNPRLSAFYTPLSTNKDRNNVTYVSTFEAIHYPIYGSQWHPEMVLFDWTTGHDLNHEPHAVLVSQYMANFFVNEARRNHHRFPTAEEEIHSVFENYPLYYSADANYTERYYFNLTQ